MTKHLFAFRFLFHVLVWVLFTAPLFAQDGLNQVIIVNGGQFGNPNERSNVASYDPVSGAYRVFDTIPVNSVQDIVVEGDIAWVAAQDFIARYDLDTYERLALVPFPGMSAHQLEVAGDKLFATNYFGQDSSNLYIFNKSTMELTGSVNEIRHPGGTMAVLGDELYLSQNMKGSIDACPPFGCLNDTLGYLSVVDVATGQWVRDIPLDNNGNEAGRIFALGNALVTLNETSNTSTAWSAVSEESITQDVSPGIATIRYRTEGTVIADRIFSLFDGGIGLLNDSLDMAEIVIDTLATAFAYDLVNDRFFVTATNFFSYNLGYAFSSTGEHLFDFPVGYAPEAVAVHYNRQPVGSDYETESRDTVYIDVDAISSDPDGDMVVASRVENAPVNGVVEILEDGSIRYISLSPGSADAFRIEVCDVKLNPLCSFIQVTILPASGVIDELAARIRVFPNPVKDFVRVEGAPEGSDYQLMDATGRELQVTREPEMDLGSYPSGMYFLCVRAGALNGTAAFQVIKP